MGSMLKHQKNIRPLAHITCRDRNLIGLQSHLMGLDALGIHDILAVTGDPTKIGDFPGATSVYDVSSLELIQLIKQLNEGISFSGKSLRKKANFSVAAAFNPNVRVLDRAVKRLEKKIECGADYFITQPVYSKEKIHEIYEATKHLSTPIFIGIMPLTNSRNSEFLHNEVPGIKLSEEVLERMRSCGEDRERATAEGIQISKELIDTAAELFNGIYIITPFFRYDMSLELIHYIQETDGRKREDSAMSKHLIEQQLQQRILIIDGAMGTMIQNADLSPEDFGGEEYDGCNEYLNIVKPDVIEHVHREYLAAGADIICTNTFGGTPVVLNEYDLGAQAHDINFRAAQLAKICADEFSTPDWPRFVAGAIGPTTKTLSVTGGITFDELTNDFYVQAKALVEGGADVILLETSQDMLNVKAATIGIQQAFMS